VVIVVLLFIVILNLSYLSIQNGIVHSLIWNIPYRSVGVERVKKKKAGEN